MGYSCTKSAYDTLQRTMNKATGKDLNWYQFGNTWKNGETEYFFERGRENTDGRFTAIVYKNLGGPTYAGYCKKFGSILISSKGFIKTWSGMPKENWMNPVMFQII